MTRRTVAFGGRVLVVAMLAAACGRSRGGPGAPSPLTPVPSPTSLATYPVTGIIYYDENGNGVLDADEAVRLPGVIVDIGGVQAVSLADGRFLASAVPGGVRSASIESVSLPPEFQPGQMPMLSVPAPDTFSLAVPVVLPAADNRPNVYMAFGDSITVGDGSRGRRGYRSELAARLRNYFGRAEVVDEGVESTKSSDGAARLPDSIARVRPAWTLVLYGTNDWNSSGDRANFTTAENLRRIVREARAAGSHPVIGTVIPVNPNGPGLPAERNAWVEGTNARIKAMALEEHAPVADAFDAFTAEAGGDLPALFSDHVHPNDRGYAAIADAFYRALTLPVGGGSLAAGTIVSHVTCAGPGLMPAGPQWPAC